MISDMTFIVVDSELFGRHESCHILSTLRHLQQLDHDVVTVHRRIRWAVIGASSAAYSTMEPYVYYYTVFQKNQAPKTLDGSNFVKY